MMVRASCDGRSRFFEILTRSFDHDAEVYSDEAFGADTATVNFFGLLGATAVESSGSISSQIFARAADAHRLGDIFKSRSYPSSHALVR